MTRPVLDLAYKAVTAIAGISLAINAYLIQTKVEEMTTSIKNLNDNIGVMTVQQARLEIRQEAYANEQSSHDDRLTYIERTLKRMN